MQTIIKYNSDLIINDFAHNLYQNIGFLYKFHELKYFAPIQLPPEISSIIENYGFYLAGGAVVDIISNFKPNDYDLFYVGTVNDFTAVYNKLKQIYGAGRENRYVYTFKKDEYKIQIIKRVYESPRDIISAFDIDICRFICIEGRAYGLTHSIDCFKKRRFYINTAHTSLNFGYRLQKYIDKGFNCHSRYGSFNMRAFTNFNYDYGAVLSDYAENIDLELTEYDLATNLKYMFQLKYDYLYIRNNVIYSKQDFMDEFEKKDIIYNFTTPVPYNLLRNKEICKKIISEGYKEYKKIKLFVEYRNIKNFHDVKPNISELVIGITRINIFIIFPWLGPFIRYAPFCKNIKMLILYYYFEIEL